MKEARNTARVLIGNTTFATTAPQARTLLENAAYEIVENPYNKPLTEAQLMEAIVDVDAIISGFNSITSRVLQRANQLKIIAQHGVGVDSIDVKTASELGIVVTNTPGANRQAVAELTFGLILSLARRIPDAHSQVIGGGWPVMRGVEVGGKTLGIIGLGRIGQAVATRALGFEMNVLAHVLRPNHEFLKNEQRIKRVSLEELLSRSDFVTVHVPLRKQTVNLISEKELSLMKQNAFLINTARGGVVDEQALFKALTEESIAGAALDCLSTEPPGMQPPQLPNLIVTPHMGGFTEEALSRASLSCAESVADVLGGIQPEFVVNPEVLSRLSLKERH